MKTFQINNVLIYIYRVENNGIDLFDHSSYHNLLSISGVMDRVCTCNRNEENDEIGTIECTYGTHKDCKFVIGKNYHCILNPEGQLRRKRDIHHLEKISSIANGTYLTSLIVSMKKAYP